MAVSLRQQLRAAAQRILIDAGTLAGSNVFLPRDWPTSSAIMPNISLQTPREQKQNAAGRQGPPQFNATIWLQLRCQVQGTDVGQVEDDLETLADQAEAAVMGLLIGPPQAFQQIVQGELELTVTSDQAAHQGEAVLQFGFEYRQRFDAAPAPPFTGLDLTVAQGPQLGAAVLLPIMGALPAGETVLSFALPLPDILTPGLYVLNRTNPGSIAAGTGIQAIDRIMGTITLTSPTEGDIGLGDTIAFVARVLAEIDIDLPSS